MLTNLIMLTAQYLADQFLINFFLFLIPLLFIKLSLNFHFLSSLVQHLLQFPLICIAFAIIFFLEHPCSLFDFQMIEVVSRTHS
jgi:hypothetical protein